MSVVVCVKDNNRVILGCDSQVSSSRSKFTLTNQNNYKIWKIEPFGNSIMMGGVGSLRDINVLMVEEDLIDELAFVKDDIDFRYVVKRFVPKIFRVLEEHSLLQKEDGGLKYMQSSFILVVNSSVYEIGRDGSVIEIDDYTAIGSGQDIALGSLNTTASYKPEERIIKAIEASCKTNLYVNYPIIIATNDVDEMKIIHSNK